MTADCPGCGSDVFVTAGRFYEHRCKACDEPFGEQVHEFIGYAKHHD
jgi:hypothetical protein